MIFAAGTGSRLKDETQTKPKALVEVNGKTLLQNCIEKLKQVGVDEIVINVHHFASQIVNYLSENSNFGIKIHISDETDELLDTGGGLMRAKHFLKDEKHIFLHNVDIISEINLNEMMKFHIKSGALATVAVKNRETTRKLLFDSENSLSGWRNLATGEEIITRISHNHRELAFSGIHIIDYKLFELIKNTGKFSIFKAFLDLSDDYKITSFVHDNDSWLDVGKPETLEQARQLTFL